MVGYHMDMPATVALAYITKVKLPMLPGNFSPHIVGQPQVNMEV